MMISLLSDVLVAAVCTVSIPDDDRLDVTRQTVQNRSGDEYQADVGQFRVRENRTVPDTRTIQLAFVRLRSTAAEPGPPLFLLPGGPGNSAVSTARSPAWRPAGRGSRRRGGRARRRRRRPTTRCRGGRRPTGSATRAGASAAAPRR